MFDPRDDARDRDGREDGRERVYDERDRDDDPREGLMRDLDLPRGQERELVASVTASTSWTAKTAARWPLSAPFGWCPSVTSISTTTPANTCTKRASSRQWRSATTCAD